MYYDELKLNASWHTRPEEGRFSKAQVRRIMEHAMSGDAVERILVLDFLKDIAHASDAMYAFACSHSDPDAKALEDLLDKLYP